MLIEKKFIHDAVALGVKDAGYRKKGNVWFRRNDESVTVLDLQHSLYGKKYYMNLGVKYDHFGEFEGTPKTYQCDVYLRAEQAASDRHSVYEILTYNCEDEDPGNRSGAITALVRDEVVPFLVECSTVESGQARGCEWKARRGHGSHRPAVRSEAGDLTTRASG